jgi:hypothetical protein
MISLLTDMSGAGVGPTLTVFDVRAANPALRIELLSAPVRWLPGAKDRWIDLEGRANMLPHFGLAGM